MAIGQKPHTTAERQGLAFPPGGVFRAALDAVIVMTADGLVVDWNPAAERTFGWSHEEAVGRELAQLVIPAQLRTAHRTALQRYLASRRPTILDRRLELTGMRADGAEFPVELTVTRVPDVEPPIFAGFLRDLTRRRQADRQRERERARLTFLAGAHAVLDESLELDEMLTRLASLAVPDVTDWCLVDLATADGRLRNVALAHANPAKVAAVRELRTRYPPRPEDPVGAPNVLRTGASELYPQVDDALLVAAARDDEHLRLLRELRFESGMVVPLTARGRTLGAMTLVAAESARHYDADDLAFAEDLGRRAAVAIDNARLYAEQRNISEDLQRSLLPQRLPVIPHATVAARYSPAGIDAQVGGDWYDAIPLDDGRFGLAIGDVVGHGVKAAAIMGQLRTALRAYALEAHEPSGVVERLKAMLLASGGERMMGTLLFMIFDPVTGDLAYSSAGHLPALVRRPDGGTEYLDDALTTPLGVTGPAAGERRTRLERGSVLLLYTDGLIERRNEDLGSGLVRLERALADGPEDAEQVLDHVLSALIEEEAASDDVALLALATPVEEPSRPVVAE